VEEGHVRLHVAVGRDLDRANAEHRFEEREYACRCQPPQIPVSAVLQADAACGGEGREQGSAGLQHPETFLQHGLHVVDDVECLGDDDAVVRIRRDVRRPTQIREDRRAIVGFVDVDDVGTRDTKSPVGAAEVVLLDLQDGSEDSGGIGSNETFDVIAVDGTATVVAPVAAHRVRPREVAPVERRRTRRRGQSSEFRGLGLQLRETSCVSIPSSDQ
jgi:hypothetical protein